MQKIERMMAIILALNKKGKLTAEELAGMFEVSARTIYRDVQALSEMEIPIVVDIGSNGGYSLLNEYFIPPIMFTRDEVLALLLSEKIINVVDLPGYSQHINTAFLKIKSLVCKGLQEELEKIERRTIFDIWFEYPEDYDIHIFKAIEMGIAYNYKITIEYSKDNPSDTEIRVIRPYGLIFDHGAWDIIAYDEVYNEERIFKMERLKKAAVIDEIFELPEDFNVADYYNCKNYSDENNEGDRCRVKLKVSKPVYYNVKDMVYFKDGTVSGTEDGFSIEVLTKKPDDYIWLSMQYAGSITIIEPMWLIKELNERIQKIKKLYLGEKD